MTKIKKIVALVLCVCVVLAVGIFSASAATTDDGNDTAASSGIKVHYYCEDGVPSIYYWNSLPQNISTDYPGPKMTAEGNNYYGYTFSDVTKINMMFVTNGEQSAELTRNSGEWWYKNKRWFNHDPGELDSPERVDFRENSIYFIITTRFYDGDTGNNVHCWDDRQANNPDSDPAWRGDFKGLIQKLDYIKALGFTAVWITPVVENCSGYDYHGYHALDFTKVDPRYESDDTTFQDVIDAAHEKGLKIVQDVVWNHTSNFGEAFLAPMFEKDYSNLETAESLKLLEDGVLKKNYPDYENLDPSKGQYPARINCMKEDNMDTEHFYHHEKSLGWGQSTEQTGQMAGDCVDINTENPIVAKYLTDTFREYVDMGVDYFRLDTEKHINRWTLNQAYFPKFSDVENFWIFGEVCARYHGAYNEGGSSDSCFFYTWKELDSPYASASSWTDSWSTNLSTSTGHYDAYSNRNFNQKSDNAYLNGITYHTPDHSKANGTSVIDFPMHWAFKDANSAFTAAKGEDDLYNDATYVVTYVDSHDYGPDNMEKTRYSCGPQAWAENMNLMFTFRGVPCIYYGSEVEFAKGNVIDVGPNAPLAETGRAYFGDYLEGNVTATDFGEYTASGTVADTLEKPLSVHLRQLNAIRSAIPALQKGQYTVDSNYVSSGDMAYIRRYTAEGTDSLACVAISGGATFKNIPNGTYIDAVTGDVKTVTNGTLTVPSVGKANMRVYVCCADGFTGISGKIGTNGTYLK